MKAVLDSVEEEKDDANVGLILAMCPHCDGEGGEVYTTGPGYAAHHSGAHLPFEHTSICEVCEGTGELEVCARCAEPLKVQRGEEVCGCVAAHAVVDVRQAA